MVPLFTTSPCHGPIVRGPAWGALLSVRAWVQGFSSSNEGLEYHRPPAQVKPACTGRPRHGVRPGAGACQPLGPCGLDRRQGSALHRPKDDIRQQVR